MFKLITKQSKVKPAILKFLKSYNRYKGNAFFTEEKFKKISKLNPETCTVEQFDKAIGQNWITNHCDECYEDFDTLVRVGREPDYDVHWLHLCTGCLEKAIKLLKDNQN